MKTLVALIAVAAIASGCAIPGIDTHEKHIVPPVEPSAPPEVIVQEPQPTLAAAAPRPAGGNNNQTATVVWSPGIGWYEPIHYIVGWGLSANSYPNTATTSATSYQATGLAPNTVYYFAVKTVDQHGMQSTWSQWYHYITPKQGGPGKFQPAQPTAQ